MKKKLFILLGLIGYVGCILVATHYTVKFQANLLLLGPEGMIKFFLLVTVLIEGLFWVLDPMVNHTIPCKILEVWWNKNVDMSKPYQQLVDAGQQAKGCIKFIIHAVRVSIALLLSACILFSRNWRVGTAYLVCQVVLFVGFVYWVKRLYPYNQKMWKKISQAKKELFEGRGTWEAWGKIDRELERWTTLPITCLLVLNTITIAWVVCSFKVWGLVKGGPP